MFIELIIGLVVGGAIAILYTSKDKEFDKDNF